MGPTGAIIMAFSGVIFYMAGLQGAIGWTNPWQLLPLSIFACIAASAVALSRRGTTAGPRTAVAGKVIMWSTIGEGVGIFIVVNVIVNVGRADLIVPGIAAVVGLHFLPMAYAIPFRAFYGVAAALLVAAAVGLLLHRPAGVEVSGVLAAATLWAASVAALFRTSARNHGF